MTKKLTTEELPIWRQPPIVGERWRKRTNGSLETRTVVERTISGDVSYVSGRWTQFARHVMITLENWKRWQDGAVRDKP